MPWVQEERPVEREPSIDTDRHRRRVTRLGGAALVTVGLLLFRGFGIPWDEDLMHQYGELLLRYFAHGDRAWETFIFVQKYGPVVAVPQAIIDRLSPSPNVGYQLGHLLVFLIFVSSVFAFYGLCRRQLNSWRWGMIGAAILVLSPRVFAHAFVNNRDIPFMAFIVVAFYFAVRFTESSQIRWMIAGGAASALAIDVRVGGVFVVGLSLLAIVGEAVARPDRVARLRKLIRPVAIYLVTTALLTVILWPYLWSSPIGRFIEVLRFFGNFTQATPMVLYRGSIVSVLRLPWHYIPWWMAISTPIPYLLLAVWGFTRIPLRRARAVFAQGSVDRFLLIHAVWLFLPIALVIVGHSVVYDDWRHMFFVYPPLVLFAVVGAKDVYTRLGRRRARVRLQPAWAAALALTLLWVAVTMIRFHPFENVYFNALVGGARGAEERYEMDYGGVSYKQGLEYLVRSQVGPVSVTACTRPGYYASLLLPADDAERIVYAPPDQAQFAMCAPLGGLGISAESYFPAREMVYSISRSGGTFFFIKRLR